MGMHIRGLSERSGARPFKTFPPFGSILTDNMIFSPKMKQTAPWLVFGLIFCWKIMLFMVSTQPVPSNDAFFFDGPVVNYLVNGGYFNPSIAPALPTSGTQVFCAYPPLYQGVLLIWMSIFGSSVHSAMMLHLILTGVYMLLLLAIFKRLQVPGWCVCLAGGYLLLLTFHDRPDSLAHVLGMLAVYCWIRSRSSLGGEAKANMRGNCWTWLMVLFVILCLCTGLQIGGIYFLTIWIGMVITSLIGKEKFPLLPMTVMSIIPVLLVAMIKIAFPHLWEGFLEHARQTPSLTGLRIPHIEEILKVARTVPGLILVVIFLPWTWFTQRRALEAPSALRYQMVLVSMLAGGLAVVVACLLILTANTIAIANYLQPLIVGSYLALCVLCFNGKRWLRIQVVGFVLLMMVGSIRAIGMTTWGLACAMDVGYPTAIHRTRQELDQQPPGSTVVLSSAYLYEAARHKKINWIHSDWMVRASHNGSTSDLQGLVALKPGELILTQFDYFRRYQSVLAQLKSDPHIKEIRVVNTARTPAPDSFKRLQKVVQHISWAPVVVNLSWKEN
jgi:hypothetical protein